MTGRDIVRDDFLLRIKSKPWLSINYHPEGNSIWHIPTMISKEEKLMLSWLTEFFVTGKGQIVDLGSFLGGSTVFLAHGLSNNKSKALNDIFIHCYDTFQIVLEDKHVVNYFLPKFELDYPLGGDIYPLFKKHTNTFLEYLKVYKGKIENYYPNYDKIELLFVDVMKSPSSYNHVISHFIPKLIPGKSIMIQQDYLCHTSGPWHVILMELLDDYFELITDTSINSVLYFYTREIPQELLESCIWEKISKDKKIELLERAKEKWFLVHQKEMIENQISNFKKSLHLLKYDLN